MMRYFFVGGAPKSGTTWLQMALDLHPNVVCSGEGHFHEFIMRPMLDMFPKYNAKLSYVSHIVYQDKFYYTPVELPMIKSLTRNIIISLLSQRCDQNTIAVGDKTPKNAQRINDLNELFPELLFIFIVRDPRDVAASRLHHAFRELGAEALDSRSKLYHDVIYSSSKDWQSSFSKVSEFALKHPDRVIFVKYEDMLDNAELQLKRAFSFLGVSTSQPDINNIVERSSFETLSGRKPGEEDKASFYRKGVHGDWPSVLVDSSVGIVLAACASGMKAMGYYE